MLDYAKIGLKNLRVDATEYKALITLLKNAGMLMLRETLFPWSKTLIVACIIDSTTSTNGMFLSNFRGKRVKQFILCYTEQNGASTSTNGMFYVELSRLKR
jgi:hypothetical protein